MIRTLVCIVTLLGFASALHADTVYVSRTGDDPFSGSILEVTSLGNVITYRSGVTSPSGLAFNSAGDLLVANSYQSQIVKSGLRRNERSGERRTTDTI